MREEILYKESKTGTTIVYFDTYLQPQEGKHPAYMTFDNLDRPYEITAFDGNQMWQKSGLQYSGVDINSIGVATLSGTVYTKTVDFLLSPGQKAREKRNFEQEMYDLFSGGSQSYIFFREQLIDDMFVTIGLERTQKTLDTLSIYNSLKNSFPTQESETGTVFGRLTAIQKLKDESGKNIKIPLSNVPIGVFAPSDMFGVATDVDENGSRISLNLQRGSVPEDYFNAESFSADTQQYLQSGENFTQVPSHYKYMSYTNDEGEFVIHNVPVGTQTLVFEVDMFKQGLTKDEISLNFFPFPSDNQPNIDTVPSFFFRQFPIDVIPTWGDFQTGYTEVNISTSLDLRKWSTFFVPPVTMGDKTIEDLQALGVPFPIQVQIRDMATEGFPIRDIEMVEIPDIQNREQNQQLSWKNEIKQLKNRVEIRRNGWQAFKVPANCYDPRGLRTDREGTPTGNRGVWLAAYQMKLSYDTPDSIYRATGQRAVLIDEESLTIARRDHFHLNYPYDNFDDEALLASASVEGASAGVFPYEKAWSHYYPEPYRIPKLPSQDNPNYYDNTSDEGSHVLEHPLYTDGDRIGHPFLEDFRDDGFGGGTGGYGVEADVNTEEWFKNDFSRLVTKNILYRYENRGNRTEEYANGFKPNIDTFPAQPGVSSVVNGEKYQRTECGYGYFMRPEGWARTAIYPWWGISEATFFKDLQNPNTIVSPADGSAGGTVSVAPHFTSMNIVSTNLGQRTSLDLGSNTNRLIKNGFLDLYRIVNSSPENLNPIELGEVISKTKFHFGKTRIQNAHTTGSRKPQFKNSSSNQDEWLYADRDEVNQGTTSNAKLFVQNLGVKDSKLEFGNGNTYTLAPGQGLELSLSEIAPDWGNVSVTAEGNVNFDYELRTYTHSLYAFEFRNVNFYKNLGNAGSSKLKKVNLYTIQTQESHAGTEAEGFGDSHLHSITRNVKTNSNARGKQKCDGDSHQNTADIRYKGSFWDGANDKRHVMSYWSSSEPYPLTCSEDGGYEIISTTTLVDVFTSLNDGNLVEAISGISNLLDDIF
jgi:hypothetical protein